jgi:hypothetical protein
MKFVQIIEYTTSKPEEAQKALDAYLAASEGKRTNSSGMTASDRDKPNTYMNIVVFPSYDAAQKNSELPETQALGEAMMKVTDGPPTFRNLDVEFEAS